MSTLCNVFWRFELILIPALDGEIRPIYTEQVCDKSSILLYIGATSTLSNWIMHHPSCLEVASSLETQCHECGMRCHDYEEAEKHSFFQMNGGRRPGAGRKPGKRSPQHQLAADTFSRVLAAADAESIWKKLLTCNQMKVVADCLQYLTDRVLEGLSR
jgi:hypothetical protein